MSGDFRRHDDDPIYQRLTRLEHHVGTLETKVNTLTLEQKHMLDLFGARFSTVEKQQEHALSELRSLSTMIAAMASEPDKSPAGRALLRSIEEFAAGAEERAKAVAELKKWQQHVDGVLYVLKWLGASGVAALVWVALRAFGKVP